MHFEKSLSLSLHTMEIVIRAVLCEGQKAQKHRMGTGLMFAPYFVDGLLGASVKQDKRIHCK